MKAMILAAGVGERMRPLTDTTPKPLLEIAGKPLIHYHLDVLAAAGVSDVVVNVSHLADQIVDDLGDGSRWGVTISYSLESRPLETAGGIKRALTLLGEAPFLVVNGDIFTDYPLARLLDFQLAAGRLAHLVMVPNPAHHPEGDFLVSKYGVLQCTRAGDCALTYAGIGVYSPALFAGMTTDVLTLRPLLDAAIQSGLIGGESYYGVWHDIGTPERLAEINALY